MSNRKPKRNNRKNLTKFKHSWLTPENKVDTFTWITNGLRITLNPTKGFSVYKDWTKSIAKDANMLKELGLALEQRARESMGMVTTETAHKESESITQS